MKQITMSELNFSIFLIHQLAKAWGKPVAETYQILTDTDILDGYVFECYDTLHTLGEKYLVEELTEFSRERGALI